MKRAEDRRRAKGIVSSPSAANSPAGDDDTGSGPGTPHGGAPGSGKRGGRKKVNPEGTGRRCANCGMVGHIKTNKKSVRFSFDPPPPAERWLCEACEEYEAASSFGFKGAEKKVARQRTKKPAAEQGRRDSLLALG